MPEMCHTIEQPIVCKKVEEPVKVKSIGEHINDYIAMNIEKPMVDIAKSCETVTKRCETVMKPCETVMKPCETITKCIDTKTPMIKHTKPVGCHIEMPEECKYVFEREDMPMSQKPFWQQWFLEECKPLGACEDTSKMTSSPSMEHIICPMCGIAVTKESTYEFELHVNSHFTD
jgi:hypothetical protein